ncbi:MAG: Ig-like domain-containing protein [Spirochaetales bacterium]|nr:Ig-like domain-containing protein [Spirochaetales bacterium]
MKKFIFPLLILLTFVSCDPPTNLLDKLEDDVKAANDLYLEILSISPDENELFTNPGAEVRIEFDRAIDMESIEDLVTILDAGGDVFGTNSDIKTLEYDFDESSNILTVAADPYLDGLEQYTVEILEGLKGKDGSLLREKLSWSFTTNDDPRGYIEIVEEYTNDTVTVNLFSEGATFYAMATSAEGVESSTDWIAITSNPMQIDDVPVEAVNDETSLFVKFRDGMINEARSANVSRIEQDSTIHDSIAPVITMSSTTLYGNIANSGNPTATATVTDSSSGVASVLWSEEGGSDLNFLQPYQTSSVVDTGVDGDAAVDDSYTIKLTATDIAGNESSSTRTLVRDMERPSLPTSINELTTATNPMDGSMLYTNDILPDYSFTPSTAADGGSYQYRIGSPGSKGTIWSSFYTYSTSAIKGYPVMSYGNDQEIQFRSIDKAGNPSSSNSSSDKYLIVPSKGYSPANGAIISGDLVWAPVKNAVYYKAYFGSSSRTMNEIYINRLFDKLNGYYEGTPRQDPYVDTSELGSLLLGSTYYWHYAAFDASDGLLYSSMLDNRNNPYSFKTSIFKF